MRSRFVAASRLAPQGPDRLHGGAAGGQARPLRESPAQFHRPEQPRGVAVLRQGPRAHRRAHLPGEHRDSTHSGDIDYAELLPSLFQLKAGNFYIALAGESDRVRILKIIRQHMKADHRVFVGVVSPIDPHSRRRRR